MPAVEAVLFQPMRSIGGFVAQVTVSEDHRDQLMITQHPVETGAAITDHAFKVPPIATIEAGWAMDPATIMSLYSQLLALQEGRQPITVYTGKRVYSNMLVAQLRTLTDNRNANTLLVQFILQNIILVSTQTYQAPAAPAGTGAPQNQSEPQNTAAPSEQGQQSLQPAPYYNPPPIGPQPTPLPLT
jgi:hypothetical protein